jgi:hypothetical protein
LFIDLKPNENKDIYKIDQLLNTKVQLDALLTLEIPLKTTVDIEDAVETVTKCIQGAAWQEKADREDTCTTIRCPIKLK